ncbi:Rossmann-like domain-containing protein [Natrialba swarupiae]|uniref:Putative heavy-metal chelation domain-containing protein n=1 Tax=Natrialba swarupiae TaxID=2448032 RepID=A0A5D5AK57_9EURY|nr:DUF364 domain-containing protein [Natrialba swarupiae]TYT62066.1 hypothetical protein FYC77_10210 [Natrialba swarupiae]
MNSLLTAVRGHLEAGGALEGTSVDRITVGKRVVLVELTADDASEPTLAGLAHRPRGVPPSPTPRTLEDLLEPLAASAGASADDELDPIAGSRSASSDGGERFDRALAVATLNALSAPFLEWRDGDPMALLEPSVETIATVGLFRPAFRKFGDVDVRVIERTPIDSVSTPPGVRVSTFGPDEAERAMTDADVVFVTGSAFVYGGTSRYIDLAPSSATVVVVGATASFLPDPLFEAGVDVVAGATVDDPASVREAVRDGECGTGLHDRGVRKVYVAADRPSGLRLDSETNPTTDER